MTLLSSLKGRQGTNLLTSFLKQSDAVIKHEAALGSILSLIMAPACSKATILCFKITRVWRKKLQLRCGSYQKCVFEITV
jgi:hypothetical protein